MPQDISDIYIKGQFDPLFDETKIENTSFIDTVVSKIYMILFTIKGEVFGDSNFGADIPKYLWKTRFSSTAIKEQIFEQFTEYIPELNSNDYKIEVYILPGKFQDIGVINIDLGITSVNALFK